LPGDFNTNEDSVAGSKRVSQQPNSSSKRGFGFFSGDVAFSSNTKNSPDLSRGVG